MLLYTVSVIAALCCCVLLPVPGHSAPALPPPPGPATPQGRLSVAEEWGGYSSREGEGPGTYTFGYDIEDADSGNVQFRSEQRHPNGTVTGSYGFLDSDGVVHVTHYVADTAGFRSTIEKITSKKKQQQQPYVPVQYYGDYYNTPGFPPQGLSLEALAAAASLQTYNTQKVHEQRTRPKDHDYNLYHAQLLNQAPVVFTNYN